MRYFFCFAFALCFFSTAGVCAAVCESECGAVCPTAASIARARTIAPLMRLVPGVKRAEPAPTLANCAATDVDEGAGSEVHRRRPLLRAARTVGRVGRRIGYRVFHPFHGRFRR